MIRIALIGYGYWGPNVARNLYKNKEYEFVAICDKKKDRLELASKIYANSVDYLEDYKKIIDDKDIDAVALAVETSAHYKLAKEALESGKHVYVEKPFTDNVKDAEELYEIAKTKGLKIHVDHIMVYHPVIRKIKEIIDSGEFGDLLYFYCSRINLGNIKNDVSSMWDLSVHDLSIIDYLTDGKEPVSVKAMGKKMYSQKESTTFLTLDYKDFLANITSSWLSPIKERRLIIAGTKKMLVYDDVDVLNKLIVYDKGFDVEVVVKANRAVLRVAVIAVEEIGGGHHLSAPGVARDGDVLPVDPPVEGIARFLTVGEHLVDMLQQEHGPCVVLPIEQVAGVLVH